MDIATVATWWEVTAAVQSIKYVENALQPLRHFFHTIHRQLSRDLERSGPFTGLGMPRAPGGGRWGG